MKKICPYCQSSIILDYWDTIKEQKDGNFLIDVFEAWVCEERCGYYKRKKSKKTH